MKHACSAALLVGGALILGATVLREPVASAAQSIGATIVGPLDAQGNVKVHEQGTAAVKAQQDGQWNVGVVGTPTVKLDSTGNDVHVASSAADPLLVRDKDNPALHPFNQSVELTIPDGSAVVTLPFFHPPGGGVLVVEYVSAEVDLPPGQHPHLVVQGEDNTPFFLPLLSQGPLSNGGEQFVASQPVKIYGPGVSGDVVRDVKTGVANINFSVSGYVVDSSS